MKNHLTNYENAQRQKELLEMDLERPTRTMLVVCAVIVIVPVMAGALGLLIYWAINLF